MSNLLSNKSKLQTLLDTIASKGKLESVKSLNGKTGQVITEFNDLNVTVEVWTFELEDGTKIDKTIVFGSLNS